MKRKLSKYLVLLSAVVWAASFTSPQQYSYRRKLTGLSGTWHQLTLPNELFGKINTDLSDLRIIGISKSGDTIEAPYIIETREDSKPTVPVSFKLLNQTKNDKGFYFTFETSNKGKASHTLNENEFTTTDQFNLKFSIHNFDWKVALEGSNDQMEWFTITDNYRILSIKNELTDYQFNTIIFPEASYKYYRLFIPTKLKPGLEEATISKQVEQKGMYRNCPVKKVITEQDKKLKQTLIDLYFQNIVPVSHLQFSVKEKFDYYRHATLQHVTDSSKTPAGWEYHWRDITGTTISSLAPHEIRFSNIFTDHLRLRIDNDDNEPLHLDSFTAKGTLHLLYARFTQPADYYLVYGNKNAAYPQYDITRFRDSIPTNPDNLQLGPEEAIDKPTGLPPAKPLFENKNWLWLIMILIILTLGWFTLQMMRKR